jgi:hypothetical protein
MFPNEQQDQVLRDTFIDGLIDRALRRELRRQVRANEADEDADELSFTDIRKEAALLDAGDDPQERKEEAKVKAIQAPEDPTLRKILKAIEDQGKSLSDLVKKVGEQQAAEGGAQGTTQSSQGGQYGRGRGRGRGGYRPRGRGYQPPRQDSSGPAWTDDGHPICYGCGEVGHMRAGCPRNEAAPVQSRAQETEQQGN